MVEVLFFLTQVGVDISPLLLKMDTQSNLLFLREINLTVDYSLLLQKTEHLRGIGAVLFTENKLAIILAAMLLLLSMIGSIVMTLSSASFTNLRVQDANVQSLKEGSLLGNSYRTISGN